jgi:hypothetical protein
VTLAEHFAQARDVNPKRRFVDDGVGPHACEQVFLRDDLTRPIDECEQDVEGATADAERLVAVQEQTFGWKDAKRTEAESVGRSRSPVASAACVWQWR